MAFGPDVDDSGGALSLSPASGMDLVVHQPRSQPPHGTQTSPGATLTFHLPDGANSFGFSLQNMDLNTELSVNGVSLVNIRRLLPSGSTRGGYLRIDAAPGEVIYSVKVANSANKETGDGLAFDHVAFAPVSRQR
jgi:hypothetical protein